MLRLVILVAALIASPAAGRVVQADGQWAAIADGGKCRAMARSLRDAGKDQPQAYAAILFDPAKLTSGALSVRLSRPVRAGGSIILTVGDRPFLLKGQGWFAWSRGVEQEAAIIAAMRNASRMRVEARDLAGRRGTDWYFLDGAATAIDAAAAECSRQDK